LIGGVNLEIRELIETSKILLLMNLRKYWNSNIVTLRGVGSVAKLELIYYL